MESCFEQYDRHDGKAVALTPQEALSCMTDDVLLLDIRPEYETNYRVFDFPLVLLLPYMTHKETIHQIPKGKPIIVVDSVGLKSPEIAKILLEAGYEDVAYVVGGVVAWTQKGLPMTKDLGYELNGQCSCMLKTKK